jgi:nucleoid-associated protein YgaU
MFGFVLDIEHLFADTWAMKRTHVRNRRIAALLVAAVVLLPVASSAANTRHAQARTRAYVVQPGDTLWSIADRVTGSDGDPRPVVDAIVETNHVDPAALTPGQTLNIPVDSA